MVESINIFVLFWTVIDPIGTIPVFLAVTRKHDPNEINKIAIQAVGFATGILLFFVIAGQFFLEAMRVPLSAFQIAGGIVLFVFAFTMIFGESKPEEEVRLIQRGTDTAIFPLAVPSIASPGAMMAAVLLTDNHRFEIMHQIKTTAILLLILTIQLVLLYLAKPIQKIIGEAGASVVSRIMGLILASVAINSVLIGIKDFFNL